MRVPDTKYMIYDGCTASYSNKTDVADRITYGQVQPTPSSKILD